MIHDIDELFRQLQTNSPISPWNLGGFQIKISNASNIDNGRRPRIETILDEKNSSVKYITELPGVEKSDIKITVLDDRVDIAAESGEKQYKSQIALQHKVDVTTGTASYKNGVLELAFRLEEEKPQGTTITVE